MAAFMRFTYEFWYEKLIMIRIGLQMYWIQLKLGTITPQRIRNEIEIRKEIIASNKYFEEEREKDIQDSRSISSGVTRDYTSGTWAIAKRLQHTDHSLEWDKPEFEESIKRPPFVIKWIIAQIIRK